MTRYAGAGIRPRPTPPEPRATYSRFWVGLWLVNVIALAVLSTILRPLAWFTAFLVLFIVPEMIGLRVRGDRLPPLTQTVRRYLPAWAPTALTFAAAAWLIGGWWHRSGHPLLVAVLVAAMAGWLVEHWAATYARPGE